jgi:S-formylglutathione hydrolase FrmB
MSPESTDIGNWAWEVIAGQRCQVFRPARPNSHQYVVLYLHGVHLEPLSDKPAFVNQFEEHGLTVVCPVTGRSWWSDRICPEFDPHRSAQAYLLDDVLPFIRQHLGAKPPRIALLGTSMGGQGALRLSYKFPSIFPVCAAISPAIDFQLRMEDPEEDEPLLAMYEDPEQARQDTALLHVHPLNWPRQQFFCCDPADHRWFDSADRLRMKLSSLGVPFDCDLESTHGGHGFPYYSAMAPRAVQFLVRGLERERLRVV